MIAPMNLLHNHAIFQAIYVMYIIPSQLPRERLPIIRKDIEALKIIATQRLCWCRHIEQQQMLGHTRRPETAYASPTQWLGHCVKRRLVSLQTGPDFEIVIEQF